MLRKIPFAARGAPALLLGGVTVLAMQALPAALSPAQADSLSLGCVRSWGGVSCGATWGPAGDPYIRTVPAPQSDEEKTQSTARERKWVDHCHPTITQDRYGVARYHYAKTGCEFGVLGDK